MHDTDMLKRIWRLAAEVESLRVILNQACYELEMMTTSQEITKEDIVQLLDALLEWRTK